MPPRARRSVRRGRPQALSDDGAAARLRAGEVHEREVHQLREVALVEERVSTRHQNPGADVVLDEAAKRFPVRRDGVLLIGANDFVRLGSREMILREVV